MYNSDITGVNTMFGLGKKKTKKPATKKPATPKEPTKGFTGREWTLTVIEKTKDLKRRRSLVTYYDRPQAGLKKLAEANPGLDFVGKTVKVKERFDKETFTETVYNIDFFISGKLIGFANMEDTDTLTMGILNGSITEIALEIFYDTDHYRTSVSFNAE